MPLKNTIFPEIRLIILMFLLFSLGMMPVWLFTLGATIFNQGELVIPYGRIASFVIGLIIPLCTGLLIQRYRPNVARILVRILKTCSSLLIIFIIVFAIVTNLYLFQLFTWQVRSHLILSLTSRVQLRDNIE